MEKYGEICPMEIWESTFSKLSKSCVPDFFDFWNFEIWRFEDLKNWNFDNSIWWILENHEKSKTRNLLTFILPAEVPPKLGYKFSFDQKTWNEKVVNRTNFFIFGQGNPYHQSTYRFPPLHPISAPIGTWVLIEPGLLHVNCCGPGHLTLLLIEIDRHMCRLCTANISESL